mmetsp:Transcript_16834/g.29597  ORF Transcript_16834/g.29597 Transcript_16834/m.29597 type:complete len:1262 (-) Transcript_16834:104-3889(-)
MKFAALRAVLGLVQVSAHWHWIAWRGSEKLGSPGPGWLKLDTAPKFRNLSWEVEGIPNAYRYYHPNATSYTLGSPANGRKTIELWQPFEEDSYDGAVGANLRAALQILYGDDLERYFVNLTSTDWETVGSYPICQAKQPCPNVVLLGTTQVASRVSAERALPLNDYFQEFLETHLARFQDDFPSISSYQYQFKGDWIAAPFITDTRLLGFNRTTLEAMGLDLPPPHNQNRSTELEWTWSRLAEIACQISRSYGDGKGIVMTSDWDEDFKLFMSMVHSAGGALYKKSPESRTCDLNTGADAVEDFWKPIFQNNCVSGGDGGSYWSGVSPPSEAFNRTLRGTPSEADLMSLSKYVTTAQDLDTIGFFLSTGVNEDTSLKACKTTSRNNSGSDSSVVAGCATIVFDRRGGRSLSSCKQLMHDVLADTVAHDGEGTCAVLSCKSIWQLERSQSLRSLKHLQFYSELCSDILYADFPGFFSFLGGAGLMVPKPVSSSCTDVEECSRREEGWRIIEELRNSSSPWMLQANTMKAARLPPPLPLTLIKDFPASVLSALERAIPPQYPNNPRPEMDRIEREKPMRLALVRAIYGNASTEEALGEASEIVNDILSPCNASDWLSDPSCAYAPDGLQGCPEGHFFELQDLDMVCQPCPVGKFDPSRSVTRACKNCSRGTYSSVRGSTECTACGPGMIASEEGQRYCSYCPVGSVPKAGAECYDCPADFYEDAGSCLPCSPGFQSGTRSSTRAACSRKPEVGFLILGLIAEVTTLVLVLPILFRRSVPIADMHVDCERVVLKTWARHRVSRWSPLPVKVYLRDTGDTRLDNPKVPFRVRVRHAEELWLLDESNNHISIDFNTSMGSLQLSMASTFFGASTHFLPIGLQVILLLVAIVWTAITLASWHEATEELLGVLVIGLSGSPLAAIMYACTWRSRFQSTPIARRLTHFREKLRDQNPAPTSCERGPARAVSAAQISDLLCYFEDFIRQRNMYYVGSNILLPLTRPERLSYAELAGPHSVQWFVSHFWGMAFKDFVASLRHLADDIGNLDRKNVTFWVCSLSNNQWKVQSELGEGDPLKSSFYLALQSPSCKGTAMVLDASAEPLTRSWCLFEVFQTCLITSSGSREDFSGLLLCTPQGVLQHGGASLDAVMGVAEQLSKISLQDATATRLKDKEMIDSCVLALPGGFRSVNVFVRDCIKEALETVHQSFEGDYTNLVQALDRALPSVPVSPVLLGQACGPPVTKRRSTPSSLELPMPKRGSTPFFSDAV